MDYMETASQASSRRYSFRKSVSRRTSSTRQAVAKRASLTRDAWKRRSSRLVGFFKNQVKSNKAPDGYCSDDELSSTRPLEERGYRRIPNSAKRRSASEHRAVSNYVDDGDFDIINPRGRKNSSFSTASTGLSAIDPPRSLVTMHVRDEARLSLHSRNLTTKTENARRRYEQDCDDEVGSSSDDAAYSEYLRKRNGRNSNYC